MGKFNLCNNLLAVYKIYLYDKDEMIYRQSQQLEDDEKEGISLLIEHRVPWLIIGLVGGMLATVVTSFFEGVISKNINLVFFMPLIVYMADAVGAQTETVYVRNIARKKVHFKVYLLKEFILGSIMGLLFGGGIGLFAYLLFQEAHTAFTVALAIWVTMTIAPIIGLIVPLFIVKEHGDPAVGAGPFRTVMQDLLTIGIYFFIASWILFK